MYSIICLGNILMQDDGIGVVIGNLLMKKNIKNKIFICETDIGSLQDALDEVHDTLVIIDAIDMGLNPGDFVILPLKDIRYSCLLSHELSWDFREKKGQLFGIQINCIDYHKGISPALNTRLKIYLQELMKLL